MGSLSNPLREFFPAGVVGVIFWGVAADLIRELIAKADYRGTRKRK